MLLCALCLRDPSTSAIGDPDPGTAAAITIANGNALCQAHFQRLADWQSEVHGPLAIEALLRVMHDPGQVPPPPWLP